MFRNSIPVRCYQPDLGNVYDWLKQISPRGMTNQKYYPDLDSDVFCMAGISALVQT